MELNIIAYCFIDFVGLSLSFIMHKIIKKRALKIYKKESDEGIRKKLKNIVNISVLLVILMSIVSTLVIIFSIHYIVKTEFGLEGIVKGLL